MTLDENFIKKNKDALIEEMAENMNAMINAAQTVISSGPLEDPVHDAAFLRNVFIALSQNLGSLSSCFNQYVIFETGKVNKPTPIGFRSMLEESEE